MTHSFACHSRLGFPCDCGVTPEHDEVAAFVADMQRGASASLARTRVRAKLEHRYREVRDRKGMNTGSPAPRLIDAALDAAAEVFTEEIETLARRVAALEVEHQERVKERVKKVIEDVRMPALRVSLYCGHETHVADGTAIGLPTPAIVRCPQCDGERRVVRCL